MTEHVTRLQIRFVPDAIVPGDPGFFLLHYPSSLKLTPIQLIYCPPMAGLDRY